MRTRAILFVLVLGVSSAPAANLAQRIDGVLTVIGTFSRAPNPAGAFGVFTSPVEVLEASGIYTGFVEVGDTLSLSYPEVYAKHHSVYPSPMIWSVGGYDIEMDWILATGAEFGPHTRTLSGIGALTGNGYENVPRLSPRTQWRFSSPQPGTAETITFQIRTASDYVTLPDGGSTALLGALAFGLIVRARQLKATCR